MKGHLYRKIQPEGWWIVYKIEGWTNQSEIKLKIGEHIPQDIMDEVVDNGYAEVDFEKEWSFDHECYYATLYPKDKESQKQLITEIMNDDAKDGLYSDYNHKVSITEPQPTWDDVRKAIELSRGCVFSNSTGIEWKKSEEEIIEQLKKDKKR